MLETEGTPGKPARPMVVLRSEANRDDLPACPCPEDPAVELVTGTSEVMSVKRT